MQLSVLFCSLAELCVRRYETNGGVEFFLSFETPDRKTIFGFLRLRLRGVRSPRDCPFSVLKEAALLRELHVYGEQTASQSFCVSLDNLSLRFDFQILLSVCLN